MAASKIV